MRQQVSWLIFGGTVVTMDDDGHLYEDGAVAVRGAEIVAVGPTDRVRSRVEAREILDATGQVVMPGLVNAHTHAAMTLFRGLADDMALEPWLQRIWQVELAHATAENVRWGAALAFAEMIRSGTTTAADMYWQRDVTTAVAGEVGFRLVNGPSFMELGGTEVVASREMSAREYLEHYRDNPLITPCVQAHATYTVSPALLERIRDLAQEYDVPFITHASESEAEVATIQERYGRTPIEHLDALGLLGPKTLLAHCVHLRDDEIALLAERGVSVAHCPESNLKMGVGIARAAEMLSAGVNVALGTDGAATNNDLDMLGEMRTAALLQKGRRQDPTALPAPLALRMATVHGARALGLGDLIGSLEVGKRADLILLDLDRLHLTPSYDIYSHLVYAADKADVRTVFINGRMVMRDGVLLTLDEEAVKARVREIAGRIRTTVGA